MKSINIDIIERKEDKDSMTFELAMAMYNADINGEEWNVSYGSNLHIFNKDRHYEIDVDELLKKIYVLK